MLSSVLIAVALALFLSQGLKIFRIAFVHRQRLALSDLVVTGGMPSAHTAIVTSLVVAIGLTEGLTELFVVSAVLAAIVIRDALGVRRTAGEEGKVINKLIKLTRLKEQPVHYSLGHTPVEVTVGALIGVIAGLSVLLF